MTRPIRVLLVEDNPFDAELIQNRLKDLPQSVELDRCDTREGFEEGLLDEPDVILIDYNLPSFDLFTAMDIARVKGMRVPFIVVTGHVGDELAADCIKRGAADYVLKDRMGRLPQAINAVLEQRALEDRNRGMKSELERTEVRFQALVQSSRDVIAVIDDRGLLTYVSPAVLEMTGFDPQEMIGTEALAYVHPNDLPAIANSFEDLAREPEGVAAAEIRVFTKDERVIWVHVRAVNRLDDPAIKGVILNYHDITERREIADRIQASERALAEAQAVSHVGSFEWNATTGAVSWSAEQFRIFGYEPFSITPDFDAFLSAVHEDDRLRVRTANLMCVKQCTRFEEEFRIVKPDGSIRWIHGIGEVFTDSNRTVRLVGTNTDITDSRRIQEERRQLLDTQQALSDQLQLLLDSTGEGIYGIDTEGRCTFVNAAAAKLLGFDRDELVGEIAHDLIHHTYADGLPYPAADCSIYGTFKFGEASVATDEVFWRKDGTFFPVEFSSHPILHGDEPQGAVVVFKDVTQEKEIKRELQAREELFENAFAAGKAGMAIISPDHRYLTVNDSLCEMVGYTREELLETDWIALTHPDDREVNIALAKALFEGTTKPYHLAKRYIHKDGSILWVEMSDAIVRDSDGNPLYYVTQIQDVTDRHRAQMALEESQELLRGVIDNSPAVIYIKKKDGTYALISRTWREAFALKEEDVVGKTDLEIFPRDTAEAFMAVDAKVFSSKEAVEAGEMAVHADGTVHLYRSLKFPLMDQEGDCYALCGISEDVTDQARAEEEREELETQLRQAQKMEAVGQLAGGVAHDFNNLLAVILSYGEFVCADLPEEDPRRHDVEQMISAGEKAAELVHHLLAFSRKEVIAPVVVDISRVVTDLTELLRRAIGEDVELAVDLGEGLPSIVADPSQLEQIILNLAVNARDAMPNGGVLSITTSAEHVAEGERPGLDAGDYVRLTVIDTGRGMSEETIERIFEPFFTTKERGQGTGLGLATIYGIVKRANGGIYVDSSPGAGASFSVFLPVAEVATHEEDEDQTPCRIRGSETILVVEDEDKVRELVERILVTNGYRVVSVPSGPDALSYCESHDDYFDLLLTDVVMPKMSGKALADTMVGLRADIKTLYMSGYTDDVIARQGVLGEGEHLIMKPFKSTELLGKIRSLLDT